MITLVLFKDRIMLLKQSRNCYNLLNLSLIFCLIILEVTHLYLIIVEVGKYSLIWPSQEQIRSLAPLHLILEHLGGTLRPNFGLENACVPMRRLSFQHIDFGVQEFVLQSLSIQGAWLH
jgi:hypothetical protein